MRLHARTHTHTHTHKRHTAAYLPCDVESRHRLKQTRPSAQPSWHLLYKGGVKYTNPDTLVGAKGLPAPGGAGQGERSIYQIDFVSEPSVMSRSKPMLDPFMTDVTIGMSDFPYHTTTYAATIGRSATMDYDRSLL